MGKKKNKAKRYQTKIENIHYYDLDETAECVFRNNRFLKLLDFSLDSFKRTMISTVESAIRDDKTWVSTAGWLALIIENDVDDIEVEFYVAGRIANGPYPKEQS